MGRLIAVLALAGAAALAMHPGSSPRTHTATAASAVTASSATDDVSLQAERDFAGRQAELGLVGAAPLFGAEGLPKPTK